MPEYKAPLRDMRFVLKELFDVEEHYKNIPGADEVNGELVDAMLGEAAKFAENVLSPLNRTGDEEGCTWSPDGVTTPKGFPEAYKQYCEAGFGGMSTDPEYGGQGLPPSLGLCVSEMMASSNNSFSMYPGLTAGAIACIQQEGTDEQKQTYLPKMNEGIWSGTMCLTEAHCGTDLGLLRTKAEPAADGTYRITGEKIFISAGEHDLAENIIHLVLARLPDAPAGTKGISLFIVPKFLVKDGKPGDANAVKCASLEHKMGIKASATCVMTFENSVGYMVGAPNKGLRAMFVMMNVARLGTGIQGMAQGASSFTGALNYARDRLQMRSLTGAKCPDKPADPIIVHPDVRRMLLTQKAFAEGARMLAVYCGLQADVVRTKGDSEEAKRAHTLMELLTPIAKGFMTDTGFESANWGMQVLGGHGYIREWGMEQLVRDGRILQQYEGANGIQALDLLGRKVLATGGQPLKLFTEEVLGFCEAEKGDAELDKEFLQPVRELFSEWADLANQILGVAIKNPDEAGAASYDFMSYSGYVVYAYFFAKAAALAKKKAAAGGADKNFYDAKLFTARFYFQRLLPRTRGLVVSMMSGAENLMGLDDAYFDL